ncbi:hypothetical protein CLAFUW4_09144 [Fulvia fulva]|uniref:Uncharacterized protein n=1 Tax=Passalora fulva TaxID=5499 RepID=A0A9Q8PGA7_PASFU|nr:uncharacterized protein CLAFUR5_09254 [Fulvia fulva]KAK4613315.1 hypothetical protein CLAFUR4_09150 [Fulvia fulva]KAK4614658.1 hypothetical protein CLAFUR0_09142 [Fulvia fulva]UJO21966.1 hypothetical protein CLAFUR5_09254 [Fulvia fulva]WPV20433.1 hypothetical protein CLAFUW4_09144 [Fulvia fulva]WPV34752.1 hypothetical protein CLAFUW7_09145 [Fulvia fulva]
MHCNIILVATTLAPFVTVGLALPTTTAPEAEIEGPHSMAREDVSGFCQVTGTAGVCQIDRGPKMGSYPCSGGSPCTNDGNVCNERIDSGRSAFCT